MREQTELTEEEREAAERVADSENPLADVAQWLLYVDDQAGGEVED